MADPRVTRLLETGLRHFALGEVDHAVDCWRNAVALDPTNERAREYLALMEPAAAAPADPWAPYGVEEAAKSPSEPEAADPWFEAPVETAFAPPADPFGTTPALRGNRQAPPNAEAAAPGEPAPWHRQAEAVALQAGTSDPWAAPDPADPWDLGGSEPDAAPSEPWGLDASAASEPSSTQAPPTPAAGLLETAWDQTLPPETETSPWSGPDDAWGAGEGVEISLDDPSQGDWMLAEPAQGRAETGWDAAAPSPAVEIPSDGAADALWLVGDEAPRVALTVPEGTGPFGRSPAQKEADTLMKGARELFDLGDFSGSLELVQKALVLAPTHLQALDYLERNQDTLTQMYESRLGPLTGRPRVVLRPDEIVWLNLDHRAGFVLSQIDGTMTIDDIYALSGLSRLDTAKILAELVEQGVITT